MENVISKIKSYPNNQAILIEMLSFSRKTKWLSKQPLTISSIEWKPLEASGMTSLGNACIQLSKRLNKFINNQDVIILLISDGLPTDDFDEGLEKLNKTFDDYTSRRYAIALKGADIIILNKFTQDPNKVFNPDSLENLFGLLISNIIDTPRATQIGVPDDEWF